MRFGMRINSRSISMVDETMENGVDNIVNTPKHLARFDDIKTFNREYKSLPPSSHRSSGESDAGRENVIIYSLQQSVIISHNTRFPYRTIRSREVKPVLLLVPCDRVILCERRVRKSEAPSLRHARTVAVCVHTLHTR